MIAELAEAYGLPLTEARDHFEAQASRDALVELSGQLRVVAVSLTKICNDLRLMGSGPAAGLAEIHLADLQPGSSIMPGKVNPVVPEAVLQVCTQVIGNDAAVAWAGASGAFQLNVQMPVMARNLLQSISFLAAAVRLLDGCIATLDGERRPDAHLRRGVVGRGHRAQRAARLRRGRRDRQAGEGGEPPGRATSSSSAGTSPGGRSPSSSSTAALDVLSMTKPG